MKVSNTYAPLPKTMVIQIEILYTYKIFKTMTFHLILTFMK